MRDIFNSYNVDELRKFATKYNKNVKITGASKMKKDELIDALMKHKDFFKDVKKKGEIKPVKPKPAEKKVKMNIKKPAEPKPTENIKKVKKVEMKPSVKPTKFVLQDEKKTTLNDVVEDFDTPFSERILSQYDIEMYNNLEGFLRRRKKLNETIDIDQFLASGVYLKKPLVRQLILKYGVEETFKLVKDLLTRMIDGEELKMSIASEALTDKTKNRTLSKFFKQDMTKVKL